MRQSQNIENLHDENRIAQQASSEAVDTARNTLEVCLRQGEQVDHCSQILHHHEDALDQATRLVRGMTWSGWFYNMVLDTSTKRSDPTTTTKSSSVQSPAGEDVSDLISRASAFQIRMDEMYPRIQEDATPDTVQATFALYNYCGNMILFAQLYQKYLVVHVPSHKVPSTEIALASSELQAQLDVCNQLRDVAQVKIRHAISYSDGPSVHSVSTSSNNPRGIQNKTSNKLCTLKERQWLRDLQQDYEGIYDLHNMIQSRWKNHERQAQKFVTPDHVISTNKKSYSQSWTTNHTVARQQSSNIHSTQLQAQEDHLAVLSSQLQELQFIGQAIGSSILKQNESLDSLEERSDNLIEQTKMVIRRANRITQNQFSIGKLFSLSGHRAMDRISWVLIQHVSSGKYIMVDINSSVTLGDRSSDSSNDRFIFGMFQGYPSQSGSGQTIIGLQHKVSQKWLGQSMLLGGIACSAKVFGKREEWELENEPRDFSRLLCVSANWGNGGWLMISKRELSISIGSGYDSLNKKNAAVLDITCIE